MANQHYGIVRSYKANFGNFDRKTVEHDDTSVSSPRVNGKLKLKSNPFSYRHAVEERLDFDPRFKYAGYPLQCSTLLWYDMFDSRMASCYNKALARFTGKIRKGSASLGVTLASAGQSRDMIRDRAVKIASIFTRVEQNLVRKSKNPKYVSRMRRKAVQDRAGDFLEWEFGWLPLVEDMQAGLRNLAQIFPDTFVKASSNETYKEAVDWLGTMYQYDRRLLVDSNIVVSISANAKVRNPNLHLASQLGLLNLPGVAWDLIPWSFVVNMFTNMGQMVNSISDFVGVDLEDIAVTRTSFVTAVDALTPGSLSWQEPGLIGSSTSKIWEKRKVRTVGGLPRPSFEFRAPQLNLELALIAISLVLQKINKINKLVSGSALDISFSKK